MNISFLCGSGGPRYEWADPDVEVGIGGSEECLIFLARALAALGHRISVYNNCGHKAGEYNGVRYLPFTKEAPNDQDLLVAWRNWYLLVGKRAKQKWMWTHDQPIYCHAPAPNDIDLALGEVDKWVMLNPHHAARYAMLPSETKIVLPIGVHLADFEQEVERQPKRVLYFSEPARGLHKLREMWDAVRKHVPGAELASFWWDDSKFLPPDEAQGILPMRHLGPREMAAECLRASVFAYPCQFDGEISPATTIKAQIGGAVPCVIARGGMVETVMFGVRTNEAQFADKLADLLLNESRQASIRKEMMEVMRDYHNWAAIAKMWETALLNELNTNG